MDLSMGILQMTLFEELSTIFKNNSKKLLIPLLVVIGIIVIMVYGMVIGYRIKDFKDLVENGIDLSIIRSK